MSNSWENDGSRSRFCAGPPPGSGAPFVPNVFLGTMLNQWVVLEKTGRFPQIAFGSSDFSIEMWFRLNYHTTWVTQDARSGIGAWPDRFPFAGDEPRVGVEFFPEPVFSFGDGTDIASTSFTTLVRGWHYWVINVDRSGTNTMKVYMDGVLQESVDISAVLLSLGTPYWLPLGGIDNSGPASAHPGNEQTFDLEVSGDYPEALTDPLTDYAFTHIAAEAGPQAIHIGGVSPLVSNVEMASAMACRDITIKESGTEYAFRWTNVEFDNGPVWDFNPRHAFRGITDLHSIPIGVPVGTDETVRVRNVVNPTSTAQSIRFQTTEVYGQENDPTETLVRDGLRGWCAFASDKFFSVGGGVPPGI